jgi:acetyl-CoA carboxylase biotin carboxyl carrier protein
MKLTNDDVQEILRLLDESPVDELHVETAEFKLTLRRGGDGMWVKSEEILSKPNVVSAPAAAPIPVTADRTAEVTTSRPGLLDVRSPLPGTFYRSPQPGAPPFVEVGTEVSESTVVCIVETMKLMNAIHAGARGRIAEICVQNAQPVEKHSVLMRIEPHS